MDNQALINTLKQLLIKNAFSTHAEIQEALIRKGVQINQAKISRLLNQMGAVKMLEGGKTVYQFPSDAVNLTTSASLKHLILAIVHNESMIVIHTTPGSAQLVAKLLDQNSKLDILGTVAGDDTVFIAPASVKKLKTTLTKVQSLLQI